MQFKNIIGQSELKRSLVEMIKQNRLSHALLFLGKEGSGALSLALAYAQYINCEQNKTGAAPSPSLFGEEPLPNTETASATDSCGVCPSCLKAEKNIHPDIHFAYPVIPKKSGDKPVSTDYISDWRTFLQQYPYGNVFDWLQSIGAENRQGNITAEECNEIIRKFSLKSFESEYKILILWMPEYLGKEGNKLLKLIEEPPAKSLFILVAENEEQILPTILSRCQLVKVPLLNDADIQEALIERSGTNPNKALQIAGIANGNYREALQILQHAEEDWLTMLREWLNAILKGGPVAQVKWIEEISKTGVGREKQKQFLMYFNRLLEQSIRLALLGENIVAMPDAEKDFAIRLNKMTSVNQQQAMVEELDKAIYYIERNANAKMLFHALTIKLAHIIRDKTLILTD
ncbi:MAG: hypothetical protein LBE82_03630 [Chitinophagaceae bacterium]|jgi:DNA polymerase-3 subunit delta'|nr:hypothetical protein [Chitinophagaceae bacterium]